MTTPPLRSRPSFVGSNLYHPHSDCHPRGEVVATGHRDSRERRPFGNEAQTLIDKGGEKIREENIAGKRADVYQATDENGRRIVWVTQGERRLPMRLELFSRQSGSTRYKEYIDWVSGFAVSEAFFEPGPRIQFERFELDEYIKSTIAKDAAATLPILYQELLHGPAPG